MSSKLNPERLRTVQLVPLTAYDSQGRLNLEPMRQLNQRLLEAGVRCFIPCAGSAEFHSLSADEITSAVRMTRELVGDAALVMAPVGGEHRAAIELGKRSLDAGAEAILVMPLDFPYISDEGARDYYLRLMDALRCPTLVYKKSACPSEKLLLDLAGHEHLVGVKYAVNDINAFNRMLQEDRVQDGGCRIEWICGHAERFAPFFMLAGATGYTSGAGNVCPRLTLALHAALAAGDYAEAMRLQGLILPIEHFRARADNSYNISFLKHAIRHTGLDFGPPRVPNRRLTEADIREIDAMMPAILEAENSLAVTV
jgi:4-hydroxy-tetrahydrodipicolinate synthase